MDNLLQDVPVKGVICRNNKRNNSNIMEINHSSKEKGIVSKRNGTQFPTKANERSLQKSATNYVML